MAIENGGGRPPVRVGIIGLGRAAIFEHLPELKKLPGLFKVTSVCDLLKERRDIVERDFFPGVRMYRQADDMFDDPEIDLIDIASCTPDHIKHALASLKRGKWTLLETPIAVTQDDAMLLRAADVKSRNRLLVRHRGAFSPEFLLAKRAIEDVRLGEVYSISIRNRRFVRRDDWQSVKRCCGGAAFYACPDLVLQALALLRSPAIQLWSELKRIVSLGDAEDYAHIILKTRVQATADIVYSGAELESDEPAIKIRGERGSFTVAPGATCGDLHVIDPNHRFPRRRSSVRTPPLSDMLEKVKDIHIPVGFKPGEHYGAEALWNAVYATVRTAAPFPVSLDDSIETVRILQLVKKASPYAM